MSASRLVFMRPTQGKVVIADGVVRTLEKRRQTGWYSPESGGVMLGRLMERSHDVLVDAVTEPNALDRAGRYFFRRARQPAQSAIAAAWSASGGTRNYLGEWHTHPEPIPTPSGHDRADWRRLCAKAEFEQEFLLFLIVGQKTFTLWEVGRSGDTEAQCLPAGCP